MAKIIQTTIRYGRTLPVKGEYGSISWGAEETLELEDGEDPALARRMRFEEMRKEAMSALTDVVTAAVDDPKPERKSKPKKQKPAATQQASFDDPQIPEIRTDKAPPEYDDDGRRLRTVKQKSFKAHELQKAWDALLEKDLVSGELTGQRTDNDKRGNIRDWCLLSPLDPGFSQEELTFTVESYLKWRPQGMTTAEAMGEVGNDFIEWLERADDSDPGDGDQEAGDSENEDQSDDQGSEDDEGSASDSSGSEGEDDTASEAETE